MVEQPEAMGRRFDVIADLDIGLDPFGVSMRLSGTSGTSVIDVDPRLDVVTIHTPTSPSTTDERCRAALGFAASEHNALVVPFS